MRFYLYADGKFLAVVHEEERAELQLEGLRGIHFVPAVRDLRPAKMREAA